MPNMPDPANIAQVWQYLCQFMTYWLETVFSFAMMTFSALLFMIGWIVVALIPFIILFFCIAFIVMIISILIEWLKSLK